MIAKPSKELLAYLGEGAEKDLSGALLAKLQAIDTDLAAIHAVPGEVNTLSATVTTIGSTLNGLTQTVNAIKPGIDEAKAKEIAAEEGSRAVTERLGKVGVPAVAPQATAEQQDKPTDKTFNELVAGYVAQGKSKGEAVQLAVRNHPKEYTEAREKGFPIV
jgi:hypothetical protein